MAKGESHGQRVELRPLLGELARLAQMHEELATAHKLHDEVDSRVRLEDEFHADEERMISLLQNLLLEHRRLDLVELKDGVLTQGLHSVQILRVSLLAQEDLTETTLTNDGLEVEVLQCRGLLCGVTHEDGLTTVLAHFLLLHLKVERSLRVHTSRGAHVLRLRRDSRLGSFRCSTFIIDIFLGEAIFGVRQYPIAINSILLARMAGFESIGHSVHGQVLFVLLEALILDSFEYLVSIFALEAVVVLAFDVHDELEALVLGAARDSLDALNGNFTLNADILQVVKAHVRQEEHTRLTHSPLIVLDDLARKDDFLTCGELRSDACVANTLFIILEGFLGGAATGFHISRIL